MTNVRGGGEEEENHDWGAKAGVTTAGFNSPMAQANLEREKEGKRVNKQMNRVRICVGIRELWIFSSSPLTRCVFFYRNQRGWIHGVKQKFVKLGKKCVNT